MLCVCKDAICGVELIALPLMDLKTYTWVNCRAEKTFVPESVLKKRKTTEKIAAARLAETVQRKKVLPLTLCSMLLPYMHEYHTHTTTQQLAMPNW